MDPFTVVEELDAATVATLIAIFIPAVTALVTKWNVASWVRTTVALLLSAITACVSTLVAGDGDFDWWTFGLSTLFAFVTNIAMYVGVYKPQGIAKAIARATPTIGIGTTRPESPALVLEEDTPPDEAQDTGEPPMDDVEDPDPPFYEDKLPMEDEPVSVDADTQIILPKDKGEGYLP